jgi:hypothetical protein
MKSVAGAAEVSIRNILHNVNRRAAQVQRLAYLVPALPITAIGRLISTATPLRK